MSTDSLIVVLLVLTNVNILVVLWKYVGQNADHVHTKLNDVEVSVETLREEMRYRFKQLDVNDEP